VAHLARMGLIRTPYSSDADVSQLIAAVYRRGGIMTAAEITAYTAFVDGMQTDSLWTIMDRLYIFGGLTAPTALTCIKSRTMLTPVGIYTHTRGVGIAFPVNASTTQNYMRTGFIPLTDGVALGTNSAHGSVWNLSDVSDTNMRDFGGSGGTAGHVISMNASDATDALRAGINNAAGALGAGSFADSTGHTIYTRRAASGAGALAALKNGVPVTTATTAAVARPPVEVYIGCNNNNGPQQGIGNHRGQFMISLGGALDDTQAAAFYARLNTLKTALNALA